MRSSCIVPLRAVFLSLSSRRVFGRAFVFFKFFAIICNLHTQQAYGHALVDFLALCAGEGASDLAAVQPLHAATWIEA